MRSNSHFAKAPARKGPSPRQQALFQALMEEFERCREQYQALMESHAPKPTRRIRRQAHSIPVPMFISPKEVCDAP